MASNNTAAAIDFLSTSLRLITKISGGAKLIAAHSSYKEKQNKSVAVRQHGQQVLMLFITTASQRGNTVL